MTRPTRKQYADLDFGEGTREPARITHLPLPDELDEPATKRYVDDQTGDPLAYEIARIKTVLLMFFDVNVDDFEPLPQFLIQQ